MCSTTGLPCGNPDCGYCHSYPEEPCVDNVPMTATEVLKRMANGADDSAARKQAPLASGMFDYFPDALWAVAELSWAGNEKHNPGEPMHDARGKSQDDADCLLRHFKDRGKWDVIVAKDGRRLRVRHSAAVAWRALRILQKECEADGAPLARGAVLPTDDEEIYQYE